MKPHMPAEFTEEVQGSAHKRGSSSVVSLPQWLKWLEIEPEKLAETPIKLPDKLFAFIWYFWRQARSPLLLYIFLWAVSSMLVALFPYFIKLFVEAFTTAQNSEQLWTQIRAPLFWFVGLLLIIQPAFAQAGNYLAAYMYPAFLNLMRRQMALYMHSHSTRYFQDDFAGRLASKVVETPSAVRDVTRELLGSIWVTLVLYITSLFLFWSAHWTFGLVMLLWCIFLAVLLWVFIPRVQENSKIYSDVASMVRGRFVDTISNIMTVKLFARHRHEDDYLMGSLRENTRTGRIHLYTVSHMQTFLEILTSIFFAAIVFLCFYGWTHNFLTTAEIAMVLPLALNVNNYAWWMSDVFTSISDRLGIVQEGIEAVCVPHEMLDKPEAVELKVSEGDVYFKDLTFSYPSGTKVFDHLDIHIPAGQSVGLVGASGAGKSTLIQLLLRLYDVQEGGIIIDGQNIADVTQDSLRRQVAVIPQATDLFHRSLSQNISYGKPDATENEIIEAAKKAHAHEFILGLQDREGRTGYEAYVGERGIRLSGGERQRIAIARAILKDAPILILDEATSALDSESEELIQQSLNDLMEDKTVLAIAHRLSTIQRMDRLLVLENGRVIEDGSHKELLKKDGLYARLWHMQSGGFLPK